MFHDSRGLLNMPRKPYRLPTYLPLSIPKREGPTIYLLTTVTTLAVHNNPLCLGIASCTTTPASFVALFILGVFRSLSVDEP